ncbi:MAG: Ribosomal small subunit methyltransferase [Gemmatimonadetes bacterium]|nr:Ribosomal small subunit methyltransferase [Gemmatimonadota bacterium]
MVERSHRAPLSGFVSPSSFSAGDALSLPDDAAHHARVKRLAVGDPVSVTDGRGSRGVGEIVSLGKSRLDVRVDTASFVERPRQIVLCVPIGDRDRMLWLAEKATELSVTAWQPVMFTRSRSVTPRGEGEAFAAKLRARMEAALEQSHGAWLPEIAPDLEVAAVAALHGELDRWLLSASAPRLSPGASATGAAVIFGPEGGIDPAEHDLLERAGWTPASLAPNILRFETAGLAATAVLRSQPH